METIADLIDAAQARTGASSIDIAGRLDRSKQLVSNWKSGAKVPTDGDVMALARMAGQDADRWLAVAQAARTEGEAKARWQHIAQRLAGTAATLLLGIALAFPGHADAATQGFDKAPTLHYAKLRMGKEAGVAATAGRFAFGNPRPSAAIPSSTMSDSHRNFVLAGYTHKEATR